MIKAGSAKKVAIALQPCGRIPRWCVEALKEAVACQAIELTAVITTIPDEQTTLDLLASDFVSFAHFPFGSLLTRAQKLVANRNKYLEDGFDLEVFADEFSGVIELQGLSDLDKAGSIDILWWCAAHKPSAEDFQILNDTKVWFWQFDGVADGCGAAAGWFSSMASKPVARCELVEFWKGRFSVIQQASNCVIPFSLSDNRSQVLWSAAQLSTAAFEGVLLDPGDQKNIESANKSVKPARLAIYLKLLLNKAVEKFKWHCFYSLFEDQWSLRYSIPVEPRAPISDAVANSRYLIPPRNVFWADPHVLDIDGRQHVFFEEFDKHLDRGVVKHLSLDKAGTVSTPKTVLSPGYHLSYPHVFKHDNDIYMVPESEGQGAIKLFRCHRFPGDWRFECNLMSGLRAADSTLVKRDGKWWLFTTVSKFKGGSTAVHLYIYYSDNLKTGEWHPHGGNPVISDSQSARMAGAFIERDGQLFRPAQNSAWRYGYGLKIFRVDRLTETEYKETLFDCVTPGDDRRVRGIHSLAQSKGLVVSDAELRRSRFRFLHYFDIHS